MSQGKSSNFTGWPREFSEEEFKKGALKAANSGKSFPARKEPSPLRERLEGMGKAVGRQVGARLAGVKDRRERIRALADIMRELGYQSGSIDPAKEEWPAIEAVNCVFHNLAKCYPEVCHFDLAMMSEVVDCDVVHDECMVRGGHVCRFKFKERR